MKSVFKRLRRTVSNQAWPRLLSATASAVRRERLTYLSGHKLWRLERRLQRMEAAGVPGDFLEFGVALGGSAVIIAAAARKAGRAFSGFDVFGTIPPPTSAKDDQESKNRYRTIVEGRSQGIGGDGYYGYRKDLYADVVRTFSRYGLTVDNDKISLVKGVFEETWPRQPVRPIAFAHIDCDWYDPVQYCLQAVVQRLSPGGIILLDDYHDYGGCRTAAQEFLQEHPEFQLEDGPNVALQRTRRSPNTA